MEGPAPLLSGKTDPKTSGQTAFRYPKRGTQNRAPKTLVPKAELRKEAWVHDLAARYTYEVMGRLYVGLFLVAIKPLEKNDDFCFSLCCVGSVFGKSWPPDPFKRVRHCCLTDSKYTAQVGF